MIDKARSFAIAAHGDQRYGDHPYSYHLHTVAELARPFGDEACAIAYLHDVVEDTQVTIDQVKNEFGELISNCVAILTDEPGANRKERKQKTYAKMSDVTGELELALIVKVCDRLANVAACVKVSKRELLAKYKEEQRVFRSSVYGPSLCDELWADIEKHLAN